jgi:copper/silver efflux system protein
MLQTGMRAPMGIKVYGPDLNTIEQFGMKLEGILKEVPSVKSEAVFADRIVGKPYIHLNINRDEIARFGLNLENVQQVIETAVGGMKITSTVEGRERFPVRVRYPRELRDDPEMLERILIPTPTWAQIPLGQLVDVEYVRGPQMIRSEETFLVGYVLFDKKDGFAEVTVVDDAREAIQSKIVSGELTVPAGVSYKFSGSYENQVRAEKRLSIIVPLVLVIVFLILYFQFKSVTTSLMIFSGIAMAFSGGFIMLWLLRTRLVCRFYSFRRQHARPFPNGHRKPECSRLGGIHCTFWAGYRRRCGDGNLPGSKFCTKQNRRFEGCARCRGGSRATQN